MTEKATVPAEIENLPEEVLGPRMLALSPMQRRFVQAKLANPLWSDTACARAAGYGENNPGSRAAYSAAYQNMHNETVLLALKEISAKFVRANVGSVIQNIDAIARDPNHKDHFSALKWMAAYNGMSPEHVTRVVHELDSKGMTREELVKEIRETTEKLAGRGIDAQALLGYTVTDAEFAVVETSTAELEKDWSV